MKKNKLILTILILYLEIIIGCAFLRNEKIDNNPIFNVSFNKSNQELKVSIENTSKLAGFEFNLSPSNNLKINKITTISTSNKKNLYKNKIFISNNKIMAFNDINILKTTGTVSSNLNIPFEMIFKVDYTNSGSLELKNIIAVDKKGDSLNYSSKKRKVDL